MSLESIGTRRAFSTVFLYNIATNTYTSLNDPMGENVLLAAFPGNNVVERAYRGSKDGTFAGFFYNGLTYTPIIDPLAGTGQYGATNAGGIDGK